MKNIHYQTIEEITTKCSSCGSEEEHDVEVSIHVKRLDIVPKHLRNQEGMLVATGSNVDVDCEVELNVNET